MTFFKNLGIPGPKPHPIYGNLVELWKLGMLEATEKWASQYGDITGYFDGYRPVIIIRDPELLKHIFIKNSDNFSGRRQHVELSSGIPANDAKLSRLSGSEWRDLRTLISPAFNSSKFKRAFPILDECTDEFLEIMDKAVLKHGEVDINEHFRRLSTEILFRFTMGARLDFQAASEQTEFLLNIVKRAVRKPAFNWIMYSNVIPLWHCIKRLIVWLQDSLMVRPTTTFHKRIAELVRLRRGQGPTGNDDLLQLMLNAEEQSDAEAKTNRKNHSNGGDPSANSRELHTAPRMTPFATVANAELFVIAGLETVNSALSFTAYLLAKHQDVQDKLRAEVKSLIEKDGSITYDNIFSLRYLKQVIAESSRFYPAQPGNVTRRCVKDFEFNGFCIQKDTHVHVPVRLMHHDPRYWVDPEEFNPDRFSPENRSKIEPMAYIPFGIGARNCPASRFAEFELMVVIAKTVAKFKLHLSDQPEKTTINYDGPVILALPEGGVWLRLEKI
ncbi:unnamed protein product [Ixodes persulcatus]